MAILHRKEEKIQVVLGRLPKKYTHDEFVEMFIKLYSKDWGKIKAAYIKQNQDKEPGTVVNMPKPDLYLKQVLETYLSAAPAKTEIVEEKPTIIKEAPVEKTKAVAKKKVVVTEEEPVKKPKAVAKKKIATDDGAAKPTTETKKKAPVKKKVETAEAAPVKVKKTKTSEK